MKTKKKTKTKILTALLILVFIALYIYIYIVPTVSDIFTETYSAEYGTLEISDEINFLLVRDERVHTADASGEVDRVVDAGRLMRKNSRIVTVGGSSHYSQTRGIISYVYDGLETVYTPAGLEDITDDALETKTEEGEDKFPVKDCITGSASKGDPVFKVVDNKTWYLVCWLPVKESGDFTAGKIVNVRMEDGAVLEMTVHQVSQQQMYQNQIILSCDRYYEKFADIRTGKGTLIKSSRSGLLLESDSIVEVDGQKGVYVVNAAGNEKFVPVKILSSRDNVTVVEKNIFKDAEGQMVDTIEIYDQILRVNKKGSENNAN